MDYYFDMPHLTPEQYERLQSVIGERKTSIPPSTEILSKIIAKHQAKIEALPPEDRAEFERRKEERDKRISEKAQQNLSAHPWRDFDELLNAVASDLYEFLDGEDDDLTDITLGKLQAQEAELKAARTRIGALLDANLKAQDMRRKLDQLTAQGDRIEKTTVETRQGVSVLVQHLPDANKPPHIEEAEAVAIMKRKGGNMTDRTLRNWLKAGKAGRVKYPIAWDDLATVASWSAWVDAYLAAETTRLTRKSFISSHAGKTQAEKSRQRSPTA